ncbi:MAG TPA: hypothetical protein P5543_06495 [Planctomycetota bacterium]|nr:hypothetical protein [Planctomycetota bacterium]
MLWGGKLLWGEKLLWGGNVALGRKIALGRECCSGELELLWGGKSCSGEANVALKKNIAPDVGSGAIFYNFVYVVFFI